MRIKRPQGNYFDFVDNLPVGIYRTTLAGSFVFCNQSLAEMLGFDSVEELIEYPVVNLYENKQDRNALVQTVIESGSVVDRPITLLSLDGRPIQCAVTTRPVLNKDGIVVLLDGIIRDITGRLDAEGIIPPLDEMIDTFSDFIVILDLQGRLMAINTPGIEFLGRDKADLLGRPFFELIAPEYGDVYSLFICGIVKSGWEEGLVKVKDGYGAEHQIEFHTFVVKRKGRAHYIKCTGRDVTEKKNHHKERLFEEKLQGILETADEAAHRLNKPLTKIDNIIGEVLVDLRSDNRNYQKIVKVQDQIKKLNEIANGLASIEKHEAPILPISIKEYPNENLHQ